MYILVLQVLVSACDLFMGNTTVRFFFRILDKYGSDEAHPCGRTVSIIRPRLWTIRPTGWVFSQELFQNLDVARNLLPITNVTCSPSNELRNELIASGLLAVEVALLSASSSIYSYTYEKPVSEFRNDVFIVSTDPVERPLLQGLATFHPLIPSL